MRTLAFTALLLSLASAAHAQSFYLQSGQLYVDGVDVVEAVGAPVTASPSASGHVAVVFDGRAVTVRGDVDLAQAHLQAGVGADTQLGGAFSPRMRAGTWAPVVAMAGSEVRIALPEGAPARVATLARGARAAHGKPTGAPWGPPAAAFDDDTSLQCGGFRLADAPAHAPSWAPNAYAARRLVRTTNGFDVIEVEVSGFVFTGYRRHGEACPEEELGGLNLSGSSGAGDGYALGRVVVLPRATQLYATATATQSFATLHVETFGIESLDGPPAQTCDAAGHCARVPPLPTGTTRWIVEVHDPSGAAFLFEAWVRTPAEQLRDAPPHHGGFGLVSDGSSDWPTLASVTR